MQVFAAPNKTPKSVLILIWTTLLASILAPIFTFFLHHYFKVSGPTEWFTLSLWGLNRGWLWEPLTYFFIQSAGVGISLHLLIALFFHLFLLWFAGSEVCSRFGAHAFLLFYFGAGLFAGLISTAALFLFSSTAMLYGSGPPVYALVTVWAMLFPDLELTFFFVLRVRAKTIVAILLGIALVLNLSNGEFIPFLADACGIAWGFLIGRLVWKLPNPYPLNLEWPSKWKKGGKIIDISTIRENDEMFMDRMLDKIAKHGEEALTSKERARMKKISDRK